MLLWGAVGVLFMTLMQYDGCALCNVNHEMVGWLQGPFWTDIGMIRVPDYIPAEVNNEEYTRYMMHGVRYTQDARVVFAVMLHNNAQQLNRAISQLQELGSFFQSYVVLIVENDSSDHTRERLLEWRNLTLTQPSLRIRNITILGCGHNNASECHIDFRNHGLHEWSSARTDKMRYLRTLYLEETKQEYADYDYMMVWDLDLEGRLYPDGVFHTIGYMQDHLSSVDSVCANGLRYGLKYQYYDTFAHVEYGQPPDDEWQRVKSFNQALYRSPDDQMQWTYNWKKGERPFRVTSCFGGFAIYSISSLITTNATYHSFEGKVVCEHVDLNYRLKHFLNPSMIYLNWANPEYNVTAHAKT